MTSTPQDPSYTACQQNGRTKRHATHHLRVIITLPHADTITTDTVVNMADVISNDAVANVADAISNDAVADAVTNAAAPTTPQRQP